ncbi:MAG: SAM-dependent methyltransferase [Gammaproteobacteria bacterium]|nr:SAM-dependent methyltransferase [Gammaproteobacteria bacterium]
MVDVIDADGGWIGFDRYMHEVLYAPGLGYYTAGAVKLGDDGDFTTAPELSPLYSRTLASQCAQILLATGGDTIVEPGAGSGVMAAHILASLAEIDAAPHKYLIVEPSPDLQQRQQQTIASLAPEQLDCVQWCDRPPQSVSGLLVANEVLDALPFERFVVTENGVKSLGVTWDGERFVEQAVAPDAVLDKGIEAIESAIGKPLPVGYRSEWRRGLYEFASDWSKRLHHGVLLWIDYGCSRRELYAAARNEGTMLCHYRHRAHDDPFVYPGLQDITAWVDFTTIAEAAVDNGCRVGGYTTQAHFLIGCGLEQQFNQMRSRVDEQAAASMGKAVQRLLMPGEMGENFRVIAIEKDLHTDLIGFRLRDMAASL